MLLNLLIVFAIYYLIDIIEAHYAPTTYNTNYAIAKNKEDLMNIIRSLKHHENGRNYIHEPVNDLNDEEKEKKLQNILWLIKKNYNAHKHFDSLKNNLSHSATRLYLIKNPSVLEGYKNHLNQIRKSSKVNSKNNIDQHKSLKNQLRNIRRRAVFRLGSTESESGDIDKKYESNLKTRNEVQTNYPISHVREREEEGVLNKDEEYTELKDTLELHNTNTHNSLRTDYDLRREKKGWDERNENPGNVETGKKNTYRNQPSLKENRFKVETVNWEKITTKDYSIKYKKMKTVKDFDYDIKPSYKKKKTVKDFDYNIKPSYNKPQKKNMNKDFYSYGRTSIPFVGKRGIYDEK